MVRIIIKGVWKNTEDEVLKAAIAKYGKNQWARISSLLVRKTPKQCKARWYEWLDPSIKKTEWSKAEDEKLLHLAKLMPTQWRTIAPIVGRTATQCLERYQKLLDEAEAKENEELGLAGPGGEAGPSAEDIRKLRPGEIDPDPETKPARPDPIDMDEDEKEMLSEARARLANTQGKKAKRKARERQLEEARRLAVLQKKRELKAAGIISRHKVKKKGMDYNADIPFEIKPALGFYDTSAEQAKSAAAPIGQSLRRLENKRKPEEEEAERKKRQRKNEKGEGHQTKFIPARDAQIQKLKEAEQIQKRRQLVLPAAQVGDAELEEIVKIGQAGQTARALVSEGNEATVGLLGEYEGLGHARMARTPRTAPQEDTILSEARNLRNLTQAQTPLLGEEATPLYGGAGTGFSGATPKHQVAFTPNPLATPRDASGTPNGAGMTPLRTPARDDLGINAATTGGVRAVPGRRGGKPPIGFENLPAPVNDFAIMVPEDDDIASTDALAVEEDAAERDARLQREAEERKRKELERRSLSVQRTLPRPVNVDSSRLERTLGETNTGNNAMAEATQLIQDEMVRLLAHDSIAFPLPGTIHPGRTVSQYEMPDDEAITAARTEIDEELATRLGYPSASKERILEGLTLLAKEEGDGQENSFSWAKLRQTLSYDLQLRRWVETASMTDSERIIGITKLLNDAREKMRTEADKAKKLERKLGVTLGGYQSRADNLTKKVADGYSSLGGLEGDLTTFSSLAIIEEGAAPKRLESLREEVAVLERRERGQQDRYRDLMESKDRLLQNIAKLEDEQMTALEGMNEM